MIEYVPDISTPPLAEEKWLKEFREAREFERTTPAAFTNSHTTVRLGDNALIAVPGAGTQEWRTELKDAQPEAICYQLPSSWPRPHSNPKLNWISGPTVNVWQGSPRKTWAPAFATIPTATVVSICAVLSGSSSTGTTWACFDKTDREKGGLG